MHLIATRNRRVLPSTSSKFNNRASQLHPVSLPPKPAPASSSQTTSQHRLQLLLHPVLQTRITQSQIKRQHGGQPLNPTHNLPVPRFLHQQNRAHDREGHAATRGDGDHRRRGCSDSASEPGWFSSLPSPLFSSPPRPPPSLLR
jgi:hypothetical protein